MFPLQNRCLYSSTIFPAFIDAGQVEMWTSVMHFFCILNIKSRSELDHFLTLLYSTGKHVQNFVTLMVNVKWLLLNPSMLKSISIISRSPLVWFCCPFNHKPLTSCCIWLFTMAFRMTLYPGISLITSRSGAAMFSHMYMYSWTSQNHLLSNLVWKIEIRFLLQGSNLALSYWQNASRNIYVLW